MQALARGSEFARGRLLFRSAALTGHHADCAKQRDFPLPFSIGGLRVSLRLREKLAGQQFAQLTEALFLGGVAVWKSPDEA